MVGLIWRAGTGVVRSSPGRHSRLVQRRPWSGAHPPYQALCSHFGAVPGASEPRKLLMHHLVELSLGAAALLTSFPRLEIDWGGLGGAIASTPPSAWRDRWLLLRFGRPRLVHFCCRERSRRGRDLGGDHGRDHRGDHGGGDGGRVGGSVRGGGSVDRRDPVGHPVAVQDGILLEQRECTVLRAGRARSVKDGSASCLGRLVCLPLVRRPQAIPSSVL
mmetsp:Transcript_17873/g.44678  ORF Transcript_17873/g.44678 Transcript_17873/m.44678 type:complete len:218 (+) Transcript_17873:328-981(+)